ncbi:prolyl oligopeptidase [Xylariomycetidae sp. FL2044]|nr:prolyl oligopeptidase [Xylariomycetidae sp. FL2044]
MTITANKFTPEVLLSAPRRSAAVPNSSGTLALFTVTQYSFESHSRSYAIKVLDLSSGQSTELYDNPAYTEPVWISDREFALIKNDDWDTTSLMVADATKPGSRPYQVGSFRGTISNLKAKVIDGKGTVAIACTALTTADGKMYCAADDQEKKSSHSSARVYSSLFVRHWDHYVTKHRSAVFYGALKKEGGSHNQHRYRLQGSESGSSGLTNALAGTRLECPVPTFGGASDFDIGPRGLVFLSKDPDLNPALWTKTDLYYVPLSSFAEEQTPAAPQIVRTGRLQGYTGNPVFSHDGNRVAFKRMRHRQYESDKWRLLLLPDVGDLSNVQEFYGLGEEDGENGDNEGGWDLRPETIVWSADDSELFVTAEKEARQVLFRLPSTPLEARDLPVQMTWGGTIGDFFNLATTNKGSSGDDDGVEEEEEEEEDKSKMLLLTSSSLIDNSSYSVLDTSAAPGTKPRLISSSSREGRTFGLSSDQVSEFWFPAGGRSSSSSSSSTTTITTAPTTYKAHALVMKPSTFDPSSNKKKYPLAFLIHGGPQGAWADSWSTRWNAAVFAEQGYVVVMPNPTGSTGYGQAFIDAIAGDWGGRPYEDLVDCFDYVRENMGDYVDTGNAVALGASYGGYMINWIQGHPLGRSFRALVCHDGIFSTLADWSTEELFFVLHDMRGAPWDPGARSETYARWDPAARVGHWATPQLVVHSELDYRLPVSEGLAAFNALQTRGVESRFLTFPDENHWVLKPENSLVWHKEVLGWINKYTGLDAKQLAEDLGDLRIN